MNAGRLGMFAITLAAAAAASAQVGTPAERDTARRWAAAKFEGADPFFSFTLDGKPSAELLKNWKVERSSRPLDDARAGRTVAWTDPATGLVARVEAVEYPGFPVVEWTVHLKNGGAADSPVVEDLLAVDTTLGGGGKDPVVLHHHAGSPCLPTDYRPFATPLGPGEEKRIATAGGRSTNSDLPYFNLSGPGTGVICALGWPGQWAARFSRDGEGPVRVRGGQERTRFRLRPGEEVRTPLAALLFYDGDSVRGQNLWRRWMLAHNLPRPGGKTLVPQAAGCSSHQFHEMIQADEENQKLFVDRYVEERIPLDYWWMDAGWYPTDADWPKTGTWEVDVKRFPRGLRAISDHARAKGVRTIVWFEPERVAPGTWLYEKHPEWLLGPDGQQKLLNLGNPEARTWVIEMTDRHIREQGIDLYRQDFNIDPLDYWRGADAADRQGITEIRYVEGFLAWWDELRRRHPDMLIDTCASGGRRNDLETLRRSVPLLRSDFLLEPVSQQLHTYGIASWIPFFGTGVNTPDPYLFRSQMCPHLIACYDVRRKDLDYEGIRRRFREWQETAGFLRDDYYPLTPYRTEPDAWMAWQYDRPETGEGLVQAFRRAESPFESARFPLRGLDPAARYVVTDLDAPDEAIEASGKELAEAGLRVVIPARPGAVLVRYRRKG